MSSISYLVIDDEKVHVTSLTDSLVRADKRLHFDIKSPNRMQTAIDEIGSLHPNGLMLDLRLDGCPTQTGTVVDFKGLSLAQELRTRMTESTIAPCPIVLFSIENYLMKSYESDMTAHDLFDIVINKNDIPTLASQISAQLIDLVEGYQILIKNRKSLDEVLKIDVEELDPRFASELIEKAPVHDIARHILKNLVQAHGPLIDEDHLASWFAIDKNAPCWEEFRQKLDDCRYMGIFGKAWPRWWAARVQEWWRKLPDSPGFLFRLYGEERVQFLKKKTRIDLKVASACRDDFGTKFRVICQDHGNPLDPAVGIMLNTPFKRAWMEDRYICLRSVQEKTYKGKGLRIHPFEEAKVKALRK